MKKLITLLGVLIIAAGLWPMLWSLHAQDQDYGQAAPPPPPGQAQPQDGQSQDAQTDATAQPGVARASYIHGEVSSQRGDNSQLIPLTLNTPLEAGDRVSTANDGRAEIQLDYADVLRMSGNATAKIAAVNRQNIQVQVGQGLTTYSVLKGSEASNEIDTPNASLHPNGPGDYRILVNSDAQTEIVVRSGSAEVSTPQGSTHVDAGQMITIAGTDSPQYRVDSAPGRDDWDSWNADRDRRVETAPSYTKTNRYYTGSEDLDGYGSWSEVPDYGQVWFPSYGPGWVPYRDGRWVYQPYYGWTWVSYEPWGWAPYHYGRWFVYGGRWGWWPGVAYGGYYPVWSPAYVSFFGWGGAGWSVSVGFGYGGYGRVGWLPIGPGDWYHPWYGHYGSRVNVVNVHNTTVINNFHDGFGPLYHGRGRQFSNVDEAFRNERIRGGMSSMDGRDFGRSRVPMQQEHITEASFRDSRMMAGKMPISPSRESFSPTGREANPSAFRNAPSQSQRFFTPNRGGGFTNSGENRNNGGGGGNEQFRSFGNNNASSREQTPFAGDRNTTHTMRPTPQGMAPADRTNPQSFSQQGQSGRPGWRTFTPPNSANGGNQSGGSGAQRGADANRGNGNTQQPFGGNRGMNNAPAENRNGSGGGGNGNWRQFTPPSRESQPQGGQNNRNFSQPGQAPRSFQPPAQEQQRGGNFNPRGGNSGNSGNWQPFTPPSRNSQPQDNRNFSQQGQNNRSFQPTAQGQRGRNADPRPTLDMRQPIATPRGSERQQGDSRGGSGYGDGPRGGGGNVAPPRGGYSGGAGGGGYSSGGGGYSGPRGGGGSSGGSYSAPRGGGGGGGGSAPQRSGGGGGGEHGNSGGGNSGGHRR